MPVAHSVEFKCPKCRSNYYGSKQLPDGTLERICHGCYSFIWHQRMDWSVFFLIGQFLNQDDYQDYMFTGFDKKGI